MNIKIRQGTDGKIPFRTPAVPPSANPAVRGQSYVLKAVSDRRLTRSMTANRRNVLPIAWEVIQVPKYTCLFAA
ncbi:hypothetical protein K8P02_05070 [Bacteroides nordii]|uniref:hypothetical protein n=2 Tax=Bacteroidales TaxID=171549 RepID=UPI00138E551F|nr:MULTISPECIES: hypothetical protein [Bacteroides]MCY6363449.1 hypothetical protein [Bacteroides ovatus]UAK44997.1 hypothetical protein K8P02_05070 [Bacteroides nordii]